MSKNLRVFLLSFGLAMAMTFTGVPFGCHVETYSQPGTIGVDFHVTVTFLFIELIDLGHFGYPGGSLQGYAYAVGLNFILAFVLVYLVTRRLWKSSES